MIYGVNTTESEFGNSVRINKNVTSKIFCSRERYFMFSTKITVFELFVCFFRYYSGSAGVYFLPVTVLSLGK